MHDRFEQYRRLDYESFRRLAQEEGLSAHQRIGFPDEYRAGFADAILADLFAKIPALGQEGSTVVEIGPGCGELGARIVELACERRQNLWLIDSPEVLAALPGSATCHQLPGIFPNEVADRLEPLIGKVDAVISYSVLHYVFNEGNLFRFVDVALSLLAPGGRLLIGDVPNSSMLRRFLDSERGRQYHRRYTGIDEDPKFPVHEDCSGQIDDGVIFGMILRARKSGFHAYITPQSDELPMANRREDLLFIRP